MRVVSVRGGGAILTAALLFSTALGREVSLPDRLEVVMTGVPRPLQLAIDRRTLVVLSPGARGDSAGEIHRVDLDETFPVDVSRRPRVRVPFVDARLATLGSMALEPTTHDLFLGEENGTRVYRLDADERLSLYVDGLRRPPRAAGSCRSAHLTGRGAPAAGTRAVSRRGLPRSARVSAVPRSDDPAS